MTRTLSWTAVILASPTFMFAPSCAQAAGEAVPVPRGPAAGLEIFASTDSDDTDVVKLLARTTVIETDADHYAGLAIEQAWFTPLGQRTRKDQRIYADVAGALGRTWLGKARLGTDGKTWLGSANIRTKDWSREVFLEREIVETPRGIDEGIFYTFVGASIDLPAGPKDSMAITGALQSFTGKNERLHLRANYVHVVKPELGLSVQLRARTFHSTAPGEFDYYSPRNFVQAMPVVQMRRFTSSGWMLLVAAGLGGQRATGSSWQASRLAELRIESPRGKRAFRTFAQVQYSNNSLNGSGDYHYVMGRMGLSAAF